MILSNSQLVYTLVTGSKRESGRPRKKNNDPIDGVEDEDFIDDADDELFGRIGIDIDSASSGTQKYLTPLEAK
jgi:hypothetical protein